MTSEPNGNFRVSFDLIDNDMASGELDWLILGNVVRVQYKGKSAALREAIIKHNLIRIGHRRYQSNHLSTSEQTGCS